MNNKEMPEWQVLDVKEFYKSYGFTCHSRIKYGILHNACRTYPPYGTDWGSLCSAAEDKKCWNCGRSVPDYIYFQWKLLTK